MKTFSRRAKKAAQGLFDTDQHLNPSQTDGFEELFKSQQDQEDPYSLPDEACPTACLNRAAKPAPRASGGVSTTSSKRQQLGKQAPLLNADREANKQQLSSTSARSAGRSSGRSISTNQRAGKPALEQLQQQQQQEKAPAPKSGRLLGGNRAKGADTSLAAKRKAAAKAVAAEQGDPEPATKRPRAARAKLSKLAPGSKPPLAAGSPPAVTAVTAAAAATTTLPVAMARLLNPAALRDSAPAQTVMEAQELGEQSRCRDDAMWALDGLCVGGGGSANTRRESIVALLEVCASRRGRLALRSGGLAEEVLATLGKLGLEEDAVLALGAAAILACFCQGDADPALLAREEAAQLITALLKVEESVPDSSAPASFAGRVLRVLREGPFARLLPQEEATSAASVVLAAVAGVLDPNQRCVNMDPLKHALRGAGALGRVAQMAADRSHALRSDAAPTMDTVRALWRLNKSLLVLENACFACPQNEAHLAELTVSIGTEAPAARRQQQQQQQQQQGPGGGGAALEAGGGGSREVGLAEWVVRQVEQLGQQGLSGGFKKDCLRALLSVLMNMTQNNSAGCEAVVSAGVLEAVAPVLAQMARGGPRSKGCIADRGELEAWVDELSCCLGLLINLVEHQQAWRQRLRELDIPAGALSSQGGPSQGSAGSRAGSGGALGLVQLLCALMSSVIPPSRYGPLSPLTRRLSTLSTEEITVETLEAASEGGAGSIVEVYSAILLGFLVEGSPEARRDAAALLPTGSLQPVAAAVRRCLHFYVSAGAMTKGNEENLRGLLASLEQGEGAGEQDEAAGASAQEGQQQEPVEQEEDEEWSDEE